MADGGRERPPAAARAGTWASAVGLGWRRCETNMVVLGGLRLPTLLLQRVWRQVQNEVYYMKAPFPDTRIIDLNALAVEQPHLDVVCGP